MSRQATVQNMMIFFPQDMDNKVDANVMAEVDTANETTFDLCTYENKEKIAISEC